eukprot:6201201-Pleurochrysis_carterae.AAC.1
MAAAARDGGLTEAAVAADAVSEAAVEAGRACAVAARAVLDALALDGVLEAEDEAAAMLADTG